ncbi:MAG TPA: TolC family protein [Pyrinomonadaceae bacterium]|nr:TolC family protein [Pyrinomonadaceae bacterium]
MQIMFQVIERARPVSRNTCGASLRRGALAFVASAATLCAPLASLAQNQTQQQPPSSTTQQSPPAGTTTQQRRPGALPPATTELPPNSSSAPIRPANEAQQSTQPQTGVEQQRQATTPDTQGARPPSPQVPNASQQGAPSSGLPQTATPAGTSAPQINTGGGATTTTTTPGVVGQTPGQNVGTSAGIAPAELPAEPPPVAPNFEAVSRPLPSAERVGVDVSEQLPLSLNEAIALALRNNNDIDGSRINVEIAEFNLNAARGVYDPLFSTESYYESRTTPTSSTISGGANGSVTQKDLTGAMRLGGFSPFAGGNYQLDFSSTRLLTTNQNATLNPQFPTAFTFTYAQPLLRGLRFDNNRRTIEIAKKNLSLTDAQFRQRAIEVISQVEQSYWDLVFSLRNLQVQIDAVKQARVQVESNQRLVAQGVLAPIDIVAANTQVTTFEQSVYTAQESVTRAENTLKTLILAERTAALWSRPLTPVTPVNLEAPRLPLEQAVRAAIDNRPELAQLQTSAEINRIDERFFRDQSKPQVDLVGTYTSTGLAGSTVTPTINPNTSANAQLRERVNQLSGLAGLPLLTGTGTTGTSVNPNLVGGYTTSLSNLLAQDYPTYRVGVRVELPFRNRTAQANLGRSLAEGRRITNLRAQAEQLIEADVRNATQSLRSAEARLASAAATRASAELQFESEQRQFRAGTTTVFLVLQRQNELLAARGRELQAQTDLNKAIAEFQRATGNTLGANNVMVRGSRELELRPEATAGFDTSVVLPASSPASKPQADGLKTGGTATAATGGGAAATAAATATTAATTATAAAAGAATPDSRSNEK